MQKQLYLVEWTGRCYVVADSEMEAAGTAMRQFKGTPVAGITTKTKATTAGDELPPEWRAATPLGNAGGRTCEQWLSTE